MTRLSSPTRRLRTLRSLRAASILPFAALFVLAGCASADPTAAPVTDSPTADSADGGAGETTPPSEPEATAEPDEQSEDGAVVVEGGELVEDSFVLIAAETYADGRDPQPRVTFTGPLAVTFTFPGTLEETVRIGNCAIAYGVLDASDVQITFSDDSGTFDCTASIEG